MSFLRNLSIKTRLLLTFLPSAAFPAAVLLYTSLSGAALSTIGAALLTVITFALFMLAVYFASSSILSPIYIILASLQNFRNTKQAKALVDYSTDEIAEVTYEINALYREWEEDIAALTIDNLSQTRKTQESIEEFSSEQEMHDQTKALLELAKQLNTSFDYTTNLETLLDYAVEKIKVQWASILLISEDRKELQVACLRGVEKTAIDNLEQRNYPAMRLKYGEGLAGEVIKTCTPLIANKGHKDPRFKTFNEFSENDEKTASLMCSPIISSKGVCLGVLNLVNRISPPVFRNEDIPIIKDICSFIAIAVERNAQNATLFKEKETGLYPHNIWESVFEDEAKRALRYAQTLTVAVFAIDDFQKILQETSIEFAMQIKRFCATEISKILRNTDSASSIREKFYCLLPSTDILGSIYLAGRIKEAAEKKNFTYNSKKYKIRLAAGIANFPEHTPDLKNLTPLALEALTRAQIDGGDKAVVYDSSK
ncbi:MAG: diguanylate cyclase [Candidatus Riflebacteria bacterium]|nr:diguanylate cyclase [Candidatus Riflebacteria bacterium]